MLNSLIKYIDKNYYVTGNTIYEIVMDIEV